MSIETTDNTTGEFQDGVTVRTVIGAFFIRVYNDAGGYLHGPDRRGEHRVRSRVGDGDPLCGDSAALV